MSLDVFILRLPPEEQPQGRPTTGSSSVFGTGAQVRAVFRRVLPGCAYADGELCYTGAGFTISALVDEPDDQPVTVITVIICVEGGDPLPDVLALAAAIDATAARH
jgi:hypothetical protein